MKKKERETGTKIKNGSAVFEKENNN